MMEVLEDLNPTLEQTIKTIATYEFSQSAVSQSYVSLSDKTDVGVNLLESESKDIS